MTDETSATPVESEATEGKDVTAPEPEKDTEAKETSPEGKSEPEAKPTDEDSSEDDEKPRKRSRTDRLKDRIRELEARVAYERSRNGTSGDPAQAPREADFNGDWQAYERATRQFEVEQAVRRVRNEDAAQSAKAQEGELKAAQTSLFRERLNDAKAHIPDLEAAIYASSTAPIRDDFVPFILESDRGPYLAYHLAKNPQQVAELAQMPADRALRELARIEARLSIPQSKKQTSAPPPIATVTGGASPRPDLNKMSMEEYAAYRKKGGT